MNRKIYKGVALVLALILLAGLGWFANGLLGNPISKALAQKTAQVHLAETYPNTDYRIESVGYSFKDGRYIAHITSPSSADSAFSLKINHRGRLIWDSYASRVLNRWNTAMRLEDAYRILLDTVLKEDAFSDRLDIAFGTLEIHERQDIEDPLATDIPAYALVAEDLILDHAYDIKALSAQIGHLVVYFESETVTNARAAELLLELKAQMDKANVPFRAIDFHLEFPRSEDGQRSDVRVDMENFPYEEIYAEGMEERVAHAAKVTQEHYAKMDAQKFKS